MHDNKIKIYKYIFKYDLRGPIHFNKIKSLANEYK